MYLSKTNYLNFISPNAKEVNDECYRWAANKKKKRKKKQKHKLGPNQFSSIMLKILYLFLFCLLHDYNKN